MYTKKDHSKDEYYLAYSLIDLEHRYNDSKEECPLDNNRIKDGYIECKSTGRGQDNSDNMKFKCFTLHSIVDGDDIVNYAHGDVGYDFNPDSINVFAGGWSDLHTDNNANNIINNKELLSKKKLGLTYVDEKGKVHEMMNNKYQNRVKLFKKAANGESDDESIEKRIFKEKPYNDDDSFNIENYTVDHSNEKEKYIENRYEKFLEASNKKFNGKVPINTWNRFLIHYNNKTGKVYDLSANELLCTAKDQTKGIKVDRIFILESKLQELQDKQKRRDNYKGIYDRYINQLTDVLIQQFPFGEIRVVKGSIEEGQTNEFLSPEEFINKYFVNNNDKEFYLNKLKEIRKSKINNQYDYKQPHNSYGQKGYQKEGNNCCPNGCICF